MIKPFNVYPKLVELREDLETLRELVAMFVGAQLEDLTYFFVDNNGRLKEIDKIAKAFFPYALYMDYMFYNCTDLTGAEVRALSCLSMISTFEGCTNLKEAEIDMPKCETAMKLFYLCSALEKVELKNTQRLKNWDSMFSQCNTLPEIPELDMRACESAAYLFNKCYALKEVSNIYAPVNKSANYMFYYCGAEEIRDVYLPEATNATDIFQGCKNLKKMENIYIPKVSHFNYVMRYNTVMEECLNLDFSGCSGQSNSFSYNFNTSPVLRRLTWAETCTSVPRYTIANCSFDRAGMLEMLDSLPIYQRPNSGWWSSVPITISGNPSVNGTEGYEQVTDEEIAAAAAKGFTFTV